jgi:hypothetical protein
MGNNNNYNNDNKHAFAGAIDSSPQIWVLLVLTGRGILAHSAVWAYAKLKRKPGKQLLRAFAKEAVAKRSGMTSQSLANIIWGFATLGHLPEEDVLRALAREVVYKLDKFNPQVRISL